MTEMKAPIYYPQFLFSNQPKASQAATPIISEPAMLSSIQDRKSISLGSWKVSRELGPYHSKRLK